MAQEGTLQTTNDVAMTVKQGNRRIKQRVFQYVTGIIGEAVAQQHHFVFGDVHSPDYARVWAPGSLSSRAVGPREALVAHARSGGVTRSLAAAGRTGVAVFAVRVAVEVDRARAARGPRETRLAHAGSCGVTRPVSAAGGTGAAELAARVAVEVGRARVARGPRETLLAHASSGGATLPVSAAGGCGVARCGRALGRVCLAGASVPEIVALELATLRGTEISARTLVAACAGLGGW